MNRNAVRVQGRNFLHGMLHFRHLLPWKSYNQIHVDVVKSELSCQKKGFFRLFYCVPSANDLQGFLIHGLGIDGNPCHRMTPQHFQLFPGNAVRTPCFYSKLLHMA